MKHLGAIVLEILLVGLTFDAAATVHYVDAAGANPVYPYTNWATAASIIQDALDVSLDGDEIVVTNGVYATGGKVVSGALTNRMAITNLVVLHSVNGPAVTIIRGNQVSGTTNGAGAVRCAYVAGGGALIGFTLTNGATLNSTGDTAGRRAGGVWCDSTNVLVSNCVVTCNAGYDYGGGACSGSLQNCVLSRNTAQYGGGAYSSILGNSTVASNTASLYGGGVYSCTLYGCTLGSNLAGSGGGAYTSSLANSTLVANLALTNGGGACFGTLTNCVLTANRATSGGGCYGGNIYYSVISNSAAISGGGACSATLYRCVLLGNQATNGGGAYSGTLYSCALSGNQAITGAGAYSNYLGSCTLTANSAAVLGGGAYSGTLRNCLLAFNRAYSGSNYFSGSLAYCCTMPAASGTGNIALDPQLADWWHLSPGSPCRGAGLSSYASYSDIDFEPWAMPPSIGCDEYIAGSATGALSVGIQPDPVAGTNELTVGLLANIVGRAAVSGWDFGDGTFATNQPMVSHTWPRPGTYTVTLTACNDTYPNGVSASLPLTLSLPQRHYVNASNTSPAAPYNTWDTAAATIQDAVDVAAAGEEVIVADGVYAAGGRVVSGSLTNRVAVTNAITVRSVNGPAAAIICGRRCLDTNSLDSVARCVYLADGAVLSGFTLTNGMTRSSGDKVQEESGGGAWCASTNALLTNCVIGHGFAYSMGGGVYSGTLRNCMLVCNYASNYGGGASDGVLANCLLSGNSTYEGGGAYSSTLSGCILSGNEAYNGGGVSHSTLRSCALNGNTGDYEGGGSYAGTLNHCTLFRNTAGIYGGGASGARLTNSIVFNNYAPYGSNYYGGALAYCCALPLSSGTGNLAADPLLASPSHLSAGSPCRGVGKADAASVVDIDGEPWATPPSIGCDENYAGAAIGPLTVAISADYNGSNGLSLALTANISGNISASVWSFGDNTIASNRPYATHTYSQAGDYTVTLTAYNESNPNGIFAALPVSLMAYTRRFVNLSNPTPVSPYITWSTAANTIQDAVDATTSTTGEVVLVTNGIYDTGGRAYGGQLTNRLVVWCPVTVRSVNGPAATIIKGARDPLTTNGDSAARCVYLGPGATLSGFTMTNGATRGAGDQFLERSGGGIWAASSNCLATNCVITGNSAASYGGGAFSNILFNCVVSGNSARGSGGGAYCGVLSNCTLVANGASAGGGATYAVLKNSVLSSNTAVSYGGGAFQAALINCALDHNVTVQGGGAYSGTLTNCTLVGNSASSSGGGACFSSLYNSILHFNQAPTASNYYSGILNYCCTLPTPGSGSGNLTNNPQLASLSHLSAASPCLGAGSSSYVRGVDIDGEPWASPPAIGCDEKRTSSATGPLSVTIQADYPGTNGLTLLLTAIIQGRINASVWDFGDGTILSNTPVATHTWPEAGDYTVVLTAYNASYTAGVSASLSLSLGSQRQRFVIANNPSAASPFTTWATAAANIQDAVDAASAGDFILVAGGSYSTGGRAVFGAMTNRIVVDKPVTVRGYGAAVQDICIVGSPAPGAVRCAYLDNGAVITGVTLTNGATRDSGDAYQEMSGGAVWSASLGTLVSNCILAGNMAAYGGGAAFSNTLINCLLTGNSSVYGGGAFGARLDNCTVAGNSASITGGGVAGGTLRSSIACGNFAPSGSNYFSSDLAYCCGFPLPAGVGNFALDPRWTNAAAGDFRLLADSPCINAGTNLYGWLDFDLNYNWRVMGSAVDVGACEFESPASALSYAWLQQFGLPCDGSMDDIDSDHDGMSNRQEWTAGTDPTNPDSALRLTQATVTSSGPSLTWSSVSTRTYALERATDLTAVPAFTVIQPHIPGLEKTTTFIDTTTLGSGPFFYRIRVEE
jgi:PKD repeat protein